MSRQTLILNFCNQNYDHHIYENMVKCKINDSKYIPIEYNSSEDIPENINKLLSENNNNYCTAIIIGCYDNIIQMNNIIKKLQEINIYLFIPITCVYGNICGISSFYKHLTSLGIDFKMSSMLGNLLGRSELELSFHGEGDTILIDNVFDHVKSLELFNKIKQETSWEQMKLKGGDVPRLLSVQYTPYKNSKNIGNKRPIYRHPHDYVLNPVIWNSVSKEVKEYVSKLLEFNFNHALVQYYRNGNDYISDHCDKTLDISIGTPVINVSLGCTRIMKIRTKYKIFDNVNQRRIEDVFLTSGSVFVLGPKTNQKCLHSIRRDKRDEELKDSDELICDGERISLTMRVIGTFLDMETNELSGQGAGEEDNKEELIIAFGRENREHNYSWKDIYKNGFNLIN